MNTTIMKEEEEMEKHAKEKKEEEAEEECEIRFASFKVELTTPASDGTLPLDDKEKTFQIVKSQLPLIIETILENITNCSDYERRTYRESVETVVSLGMDTVCSFAKDIVTETSVHNLIGLLLRYKPDVSLLFEDEDLTCTNFMEELKKWNGIWPCMRQFLEFNLYSFLTEILIGELGCKISTMERWNIALDRFLKESPRCIISAFVKKVLEKPSSWHECLVTISIMLINMSPQNASLLDPANYNLSRHGQEVLKFFAFVEALEVVLDISDVESLEVEDIYPYPYVRAYPRGCYEAKKEKVEKHNLRMSVKHKLDIWKKTFGISRKTPASHHLFISTVI